MLHRVFSIYDHACEAYMRPFLAPTKGVAIRSFSELAQDTNHEVGKYPEQYTLFELGSWEDTNALYDLHDTPLPIGKGHEFIKSV